MSKDSRRISVGFSVLVALALLVSVSPVLGVVQFLTPNPDFSASPTTGYAPLKVQFTDLTTWESAAPAGFALPLPVTVNPNTPTMPPDDWKCVWDFGDGTTAEFQGNGKSNPSHIYTQPGNYTVTLTWMQPAYASAVPTGITALRTANRDSSTFSLTKTLYIRVMPVRESRDNPPEPAKLSVSYLNIDPVQVLPNQEVVISANICNKGEERGSKTVSLMLNGEAVESQSISVSGGACQQVIFKVQRAVPGTYQVAVDGMTGQFSVLAPRTVTRDVPSQQQTGLGTAGIIAIIAVIVVLIAALIIVFKRD